MANYSKLKEDIAAAIKTNGNGEITAEVLQQILLSMTELLGIGYQFAGVATMDSTPTAAAAQIPRFWIASGKGRYTNYGALYLTADISVITWTPNGDTGIYAQTPVYTKPKTLPVLELLDVTMWTGGYSGGVKEYIDDNQLKDGALFPIRIDVTGNASEEGIFTFVGVAAYDVLENSITATAENALGRPLNVRIVAGDNEEVYYTVAGTPYVNSADQNAYQITWVAAVNKIIGYDAGLVVGREQESSETQALDAHEATIDGLPTTNPTTRYIFGELEVLGSSIDGASCFVVCDYSEGQYGYSIEA